MKLFIDTSDSEKISVGLDKEIYSIQARREKSQMLLPFILEKLKEKKLKIEDIDEIEVETGPGSFTGLRVGVSIASALGWALGVSVNGKDIRKGDVIEIIYS